MKIGQPTSPRPRWLLPLLLTALFSLGLLLGEAGWGTRLTSELTRPFRALQLASTASELPTLRLDMAYADYNALLQQRDEALRTGAYLARETDFRPATLTLEQTTHDIELRLREGDAASLGERNKWPLVVRLRDGQILDGFSQFTLQDPAETNWLNQVAFSRWLGQEGILTSRYELVQVYFNGDDFGLYGLQEDFAPDFGVAQGREPSQVVGLDTDAWWRGVRQLGDGLTAEPLSQFGANSFLFFETDTPVFAPWRQWQMGEIPASELVDTAVYARFLALTDLWAALDGLHLTNLHFYVNPTTGRLEPIGRNGNPLATNDGRVPISATLHDPALQAAYIQALQEVSDPAYFEAIEQTLTPELAPLLPLVQREQPAAALPWAALETRQAILRESLRPAQPVLAYFGDDGLHTAGILELIVLNRTAVPLVLQAIQLPDGSQIPFDPAWVVDPDTAPLQEHKTAAGESDWLLLAAPPQATYLQPLRLHLPLTLLSDQDFLQTPEIFVLTQLVGLVDEEPLATRVE